MSCKATARLKLTTSKGRTVSLTLDDCADIINAMARLNLLTINVEEIPDGISQAWITECAAMAQEHDDDCDCDDGVMLFANCAAAEATVERKQSKKKAAR